MSSKFTEKNNPFSRCTKRHSQFGTFTSHASIGSSQVAFPIKVLPKDDHINFFQEERLGLPYWTMILAICVVVDESKCLDIPTWDQQHKHIFSCVSTSLCWFSPLLFIGILQSIAAGIGTFNFVREAFIVSLNSSSFGSMKNIPLNCLALSRFGFSKAHFFAFLCVSLHQTYASTYLAIHWLDERLFVSLSVSPEPRIPSGDFSFNSKFDESGRHV